METPTTGRRPSWPRIIAGLVIVAAIAAAGYGLWYERHETAIHRAHPTPA